MDPGLQIGNIFTPPEWAEFAIRRFGIFDRWMAGASVFDPTMGSGNLLAALIDHGIKQGYAIGHLPTDRLYGNELNREYYKKALSFFSEKYGLDMSGRYTNADILDLPPRRFGVIFGNPPWQNFTDLPARYKEKVKAAFIAYGLTGDRRSLLLGGSRIDLAALVIQRAIKDFLSEGGDAYFFMPLSLLLNDGASRYFRNYRSGGVRFAPVKVYDLEGLEVFPGISTRAGLVHFKRDREPSFPIPYEQYQDGAWKSHHARPLLHPADPLSVLRSAEHDPLAGFRPVVVGKASVPRQGINTCGANDLFFFDRCEQVDEDTCIVNGGITLPSRYLYPLLTSGNFKEEQLTPRKWVLLPYTGRGRPLEPEQIKKETLLWNYLIAHEQRLKERRGSLIGARIRRGYWWALLGVGPYNFMPYKVVWEAYGKKRFRPRLVEGRWQVNQSLQAYIPLPTRGEAERVLEQLRQPAVENYLLSLKMEGTMNWAQPGRIRRLLRMNE